MLLDVKNLNVNISTPRGDLHAVQNLNLSVDRGETLCIVGESGCGKSITALALMGLLPKAARRSAECLNLNGTDMRSLSRKDLRLLQGNRMAMIFQEPMTALNPVLTIGRQLTDVLRAHRRVSRAEASERAVYLLERVGITQASQRLQQFPHELSGGLRQRVVIAMALMCEPDLIIADEPTTALDVTIQAELLRLLDELSKSMGLALIMITHDVGVVSRIADRVLVMYAGQAVERGDAGELFGNPSHPYTRGLLESVPHSGHARMQPLPAIAGTVPSLVGHIEGCHFRDRCGFALPACASPQHLGDVGHGHLVRCARAPSLIARNWSTSV